MAERRTSSTDEYVRAMEKQVRGCEKAEQAGGELIQSRGVRAGLLEEAVLEQRPEDEWTFT